MGNAELYSDTYMYVTFRKARNVPSMLNGGSKNALDVDVGLFRKTYNSENIFDTRIQSGGTVVLGEEILLRVLVNGDDGKRIRALSSSDSIVHIFIPLVRRMVFLNSDRDFV